MSVPVALASLILLTGLLAGCTGAAEADPASPSATPTASPTPSPSGTPAPLTPTSPVAGGCAALGAAPAVTAAAGEIQRATTLDEMWHIGIDTAGGLACSLLTPRLAVDVYVLPAATVVGDVAALTAAAMPLIGPLTFMGLIAPHAMKTLGVRRAVPAVLGSAAAGALIMMFADWVARVLLFPLQLPTGLVGALIGAPLLMGLLARPTASR